MPFDWDRFLDECILGSPFYAQKYGGLRPKSILEAPFTTKQELMEDQASYPPYGSNLVYPLGDYVRLHQSSGTTSGQPLRWLDTQQSWRWLVSVWKKMMVKAGVRPHEDRIFFPFSFGPFLGFWMAFEASAEYGCLTLTGGSMSTSARLKFLIEHRATVICCTPTYALRMAEIAQAEGYDLVNSDVRMLIVAGEPGGAIPSTRQQIETQWNARVIDHYGLTEVGPVAIESESQPLDLQILAEDYFAEVVELGGTTPVADGATGELVLTNLGRFGSPLIRYRTGDIVKGLRDSQSNLILKGGILGRSDDMIQIRGNNVYPSALEAIIRKFPEVVEFRITARTNQNLGDLLIEVEMTPDSTPSPEEVAGKIAQMIRTELLFRTEVTTVPEGTLPRPEMKARRFFRQQASES